jgi:hypothetical protein
MIANFRGIILLFKVVVGGVMVTVLLIRTKVRGFKSGRERWIFKGDKNP